MFHFRNIRTGLLLIALSLGSSLAGQSSGFQRDQHVEAALVGEQTHLQPGVPYRVGLLLRHDPKWHTYWKSTATGYATSIEWDLPEGFEVGAIAWPTPKVYDFQGFIEYVYEGETLLMATLTPPDGFDQETVEIGFKAEWLMCEAVCIPGEIEGSLSLPVRDTPAQPSPVWAPYFTEAARQLPADPGPYALTAWQAPNSVILEVKGPEIPDSLYFFDAQAVFQPKLEMAQVPTADGAVRLTLPLDKATDAMPARLTGALKADSGWPGKEGRPALAVDIPIGDSPPSAGVEEGFSWMGILVLAFLGGLILNLMPCVFPVLGIKIMGFVSQAGESRARIVTHGLTFTAGVLLSFWALAAVLLIVRSGGNQLGWGFQLQSPAFVLALAFLLFAFGLNMSGLFEFGQRAVGVGSTLTRKSGLSGSFFSGVLATVVATPCAAPFLAPALGAALALPPMASFSVFSFIAIGLAMPYLVLSAFPGLISWLPRPGAWMETFKQAMGFLLHASVAYLIWVLAGQLTEGGGYGPFSFLQVLLSLVVLALALWVFGRWGAYHRPARVKAIGTLASVVLILFAGGIGFSATNRADPAAHTVKWEEWEPGKARELAAEGYVVYVDFTARWCVTCQTNKAAVFSSGEVREHIRNRGVRLLKADWTHQDSRISDVLASYGRSAVPFNLVYGPAVSEPLQLPELLTPGIVLDALETASGAE